MHVEKRDEEGCSVQNTGHSAAKVPLGNMRREKSKVRFDGKTKMGKRGLLSHRSPGDGKRANRRSGYSFPLKEKGLNC